MIMALRNLGVAAVCFFSILLSTTVHADVGRSAQEVLKQSMIQDLDFVQSMFQVQYAPAAWKKEYASWDLGREIDRAKAKIIASPFITIKDYQKILKSVFDSTQDYHVGISFYSTERSSLPFSIQGANGKYFFVYIDRTKLPLSSFPFSAGDELVTFGGKPVQEVITQLKTEMSQNVPGTDQSLAEISLTRRAASKGFVVPKGPLTLGVRPRGNSDVFERQVIWEYQPERVNLDMNNHPATLLSPLGLIMAQEEGGKGTIGLAQTQMVTPWWNYFSTFQAEANPFLLGVRKSYVPALGNKIWESEDSSEFHAYIYQNEERLLIGYVRIPNYVPQDADKAISDFGKIIAKFQGTTDGLVIDQINNPGGSVFYLYALVSMLSDQALKTPQHKMAINQSHVMTALSILDEASGIVDDETARKKLGETLSGYPVSYEVFRFIVEYANFMIQEWNEGHRLTRPHYLFGVDRINPSRVAKYTKPILLLTNSLDFSGGDFFPAILQDNGRVKILGTRTAGAGGYVLPVSYPNFLGVEKFSLTGSLAKRVDDHPIENLGVTPDFEYALTEGDLQNGFAPYAKRINETLSQLLSP